ncbi:hypothetical protein F5Y03DRAFT_359185 [Xylaria venustula]|nr:hypothetical protein F5Y03DRAFT_359185 [Xylaria venustula]
MASKSTSSVKLLLLYASCAAAAPLNQTTGTLTAAAPPCYLHSKPERRTRRKRLHRLGTLPRIWRDWHSGDLVAQHAGGRIRLSRNNDRLALVGSIVQFR